MFSQIYFIIIVYNKKIESNANAEKKIIQIYAIALWKKKLAIYIKKDKNAAIKIAKIIKN